jgi:tagaturonate epimerase
MQLEKFSLGVGDRFAHQAKAQLTACIRAAERGVTIVPVWNKSNREHNIIGSEPSSARDAADLAVSELNWKRAYYLDADHINLTNVDRFLKPCNFFTIDVADAIKGGYQEAIKEAGRIYRYIESQKRDETGAANFVTEISIDETDTPQTPPELELILRAIADEKIPIQTIAPKFTGRFNKGVDYVGDVAQFEREFSDDVEVIAHAIQQYGLPANLKLSVHSGSDKFSIYGPIRRVLERTGAGVHLKTAGTTWLEELIGLAEGGPEGLAIAKEIYAEAFAHTAELCAPYAAVIDIDPARLPAPDAVSKWTAEQYAGALRHDQSNEMFNPNLRQLLHVGYKIAANMGKRYTDLLDACEESISWNVTTNLLDRHIAPLFL